MKNRLIILLSLSLISGFIFAQNGGSITGSFEANANFYQRDTLIGAQNTPQYDHQLFGSDSWLDLNYSNTGFDFGVRFDFFHNSNLPNPVASYNNNVNFSIGKWYAKKKVNKLGIHAGYIYDQIGSGIIFRSYEERPLYIDNALIGGKVTYDLSEDWMVKAFVGKQKKQFYQYESVIRGMSIDGFLMGGEDSNWSMAPGAGVVVRTIDDKSMNNLVAEIKSYYNTEDSAKVFVPNYNTYAYTFYNTLSMGKFSWYLETALKSEDAMLGLDSKFFEEMGSVYYSSLSYAQKGLGITLEGKYTKNFEFRTKPQAVGTNGAINFLPPMSRVNAYTLLARYSPATQFLGEKAFQIDVKYAPLKKLLFNFNFAYIDNLDNVLLYREMYLDATYKLGKKGQLIGGIQYQIYNQDLYQVKPGAPNVKQFTPFVEWLHKLNRKKSLRFELQYMFMDDFVDHGTTYKRDYGDWLAGLVEYNVAPHWTFSASAMYNVSPGKKSPSDSNGNKLSIVYPRLDVFYKNRSNRIGLSYVKQVEGIVCTGGICRFEPAFSGIKLKLSTTF